ncbi:MAG: hypothetical protein M3150_01270, partial [Pseudomonadota bacterium]|nr:hypothetical protein [Pseudomonadota bacterium]
PDRRRQSMTWRTEVRTPGLPPQTRRLGDLRLECEVGMEAGLISNQRNLFSLLIAALLDTPDYCHRKDPRYLFFSDQPLFSVTLAAGERRETLPVKQLYAGAGDDPAICDCEVLLDRSYFLPLADSSWPDDTLVEFEPMAAGGDSGAVQTAIGPIVPGRSTRADLAGAFPAAAPIRFDSGWEVWIDRDKRDRRASQDVELTERIFLVDPSGVVTKARVWIPAAAGR